MALKIKLPPVTYIDTSDLLRHMLAEIADADQIAIDTESNSMYAYYGRVCLIQLSTRHQDYIIDPLAIEDIQPLGKLLVDEKIEKIFHAAEYDLICLKRDFDFDVHNLFDTMAAARLVGEKKFGLGDMLHKYFDVEVDKSHQRDDWGKRPLAKDSLIYAQMDTHYLHQLRDKLLAKLEQMGRIAEAQEVFADVLRIEVREREFDEHGFWKIGAPNRLNRRQMAVLKELYLLREKIAEDENIPPFKVLNNKALVNLARKQPRNYRSLKQTRGIGRRVLNYYGDDILEALHLGRESEPPQKPPRDDPDPIIAERYIALHAWRKDVARQRNLDSSLIVAKQTLWDLAHHMPSNEQDLAQIDGFGTWRIKNYADELLKVITKLR